MNDHTIFIIEMMLALFICWNLRNQIKIVIADTIKQIQLRNYLAGSERRQLANQRNNSNLLIDHSNDQLIKDAYHSLSQASIHRHKNKISITIPTKNYPELQEHIQKKIDNYLMQWLEGNYPNKHWTKAQLRTKALLNWEFVINEK